MPSSDDVGDDGVAALTATSTSASGDLLVLGTDVVADKPLPEYFKTLK